jgi:hypothetical protein
MRRILTVMAGLALIGAKAQPAYDVLITHGLIYDGSGAPPYAGEVAIRGERIVFGTRMASPWRPASSTCSPIPRTASWPTAGP